MVKFKMSGHQSKPYGQAMVEYALILVLLALAAGVTLAATGPAIGNVFCNVVDNLGGHDASPKGGDCGAVPTDLQQEGGLPTMFWQTVTWVAGHPQTETPFPTPIHRAPTSVGAGLPDTSTPTNTPTNTATPTKTNTPTQTYTPSPGPSPTANDLSFTVPFVDQMNNTQNWRLENDTTNLTGSWSAQWYDTSAITGCTSFCAISETVPKNLTTLPGTGVTALNLSMASGSNPSAAQAGSATGLSAGGTTYAATFTYSLTVGKTATYAFTVNVGADEAANVSLDGTRFLSVIPAGNSATANVSISAGSTHTLTVVYGQNSGAAAISLTSTRLGSSPDDVIAGTNACKWGPNSSPSTAGIAGSNAVSPSFQFEDNPGLNTFPAGETCNLELRGYIDLSGHNHPMLSYWDIWDFTGATGTTAQLQIGKYALNGAGVEDRTAGVIQWTTIATRTNNTSNYAWTRSQVDLSNYVATLGTKVTFRFVIGVTTPAATFRWYLDDLQVVDDTTPTKTFTVNNSWDLNSRTEMNDFIYDGDSFDNPGLGGATSSRRWDLTTTNAHSGTGWDDSPAGTSNTNGTYQNLSGISAPTGTANARVHYLEFKYPIDLTGTVPPNPDINGNTGNPLLTFWQAYDIGMNASIRVQYTRDTNDPSENLNNAALETWTDIPNQGVLVDYTTVPSGAARTNLVMQPVQIDLTNIPNWNTQKFRLRFALYVDNVATSPIPNDGWYIDDIGFQRNTSSPYIAYPFSDNAESQVFTATTWDAIGGKWGPTTEKGGALNTATAYSDSPSATYTPNSVQMLQMHYAIDLLHDTPANTTDAAGRPAANNPVLTFWTQRDLGPGVTFTVDLWTPHNNWTAIWTYSSSSNGFATQKAWQRVEINLPDAIAQAEGKTWANIVSNSDGVTDDDDIKIRFDFQQNGSSTVSDGVYVDEIHIQDASQIVEHLSSGTNTTTDYYGNFVDGVEFASPISGPWYSRWYAGGQWGTTGTSGYTHSGSLSLTDSSGGNAPANTFSTLEFIPIVDLTSTPTGQYPTLYFWTRFGVSVNDQFRVEVAQEDAASPANNYDKIGGWDAWAAQTIQAGVAYNSAINYVNNTTVVTWQRAQVDLSSFIGHRIRIRFVMSVPTNASLSDGAYIDDIALTYGRAQDPIPFTDNAQTLANWVTEGTWGLATNYFVGSGTSNSDFGNNAWNATYFDCEGLGYTGSGCGNSSTYSAILAAYPNLAPTATFNGTNPAAPLGPETDTDINFNWGNGSPMNNNAPHGSPPNPGFDDTFTARFTRVVNLSPGTYNFSTISDDGVRLWIDDYTGTNMAGYSTITGDQGVGANSRYIINDWGNHPAQFDYGSFTVSSPITRTLTLEYYENTGGSEIILNAASSSYSFTDSPNPYTGCTPSTPYGDPTCVQGYSTVSSVFPGDSSLMLSGYFNFSASTQPGLSYERLYDLKANSSFYVEVSTDGGFTWTPISSETLNGTNTLLPPSSWAVQNVQLWTTTPSYAGKANVMIRFRLDTRTAGSTGDGVYIAAIKVVAP